MNATIIQKARQAITHRSSQLTQTKAKLYSDPSSLVPSQTIVATIDAIATGTPEPVTRQSEAAEFLASLPVLEKNRARIEKLYHNTRIETRRLAVNLLSEEAIAFSQQRNTIQTRMKLYQEYAVPLAERVARKALESTAARDSSTSIQESIGLIVYVSSTGFIAPGVDAILIEKLGLRRDIARVTVNFMGCAAAMNGLRVACDYVRSHPTRQALVVCLELSSINATFEDELNDVIIHSIFGDGCAAVVVGACEAKEANRQHKIVIRDHLSYLVENTIDGITLGIRDNGITCQLSRQLPDYIETGVNPIIEQFLAKHALTKDAIDLWAIHPGGTRIIERAQRSLGLHDRQVADSWDVLRQYGNMLSPAVLFVLERMLSRENLLNADSESLQINYANQNSPAAATQTNPLIGIAFSFSPGVGIEGILFQKG